MAGKLTNKVAVVTGAARGMGQTIALAYTREGASVALWDIDEKGLGDTAREIAREVGAGVLPLKTDVTREIEIDAAVQATLARFGRIDVLLNSAALKMASIVSREQRATHRFWEIEPDRWRRLLDVNITGTFLCSRRVAQEMAGRRAGSIINMTTGDETQLAPWLFALRRFKGGRGGIYCVDCKGAQARQSACEPASAGTGCKY